MVPSKEILEESRFTSRKRSQQGALRICLEYMRGFCFFGFSTTDRQKNREGQTPEFLVLSGLHYMHAMDFCFPPSFFRLLDEGIKLVRERDG